MGSCIWMGEFGISFLRYQGIRGRTNIKNYSCYTFYASLSKSICDPYVHVISRGIYLIGIYRAIFLRVNEFVADDIEYYRSIYPIVYGIITEILSIMLK
jgi:hypothetical protein